MAAAHEPDATGEGAAAQQCVLQTNSELGQTVGDEEEGEQLLVLDMTLQFHLYTDFNEMLIYVQFQEMEQVVMEDREEQEKLRQQQEETRAATKVTTSMSLTVLLFSILISNSKLWPANFDHTAAGLVERLHGPQRPRHV